MAALVILAVILAMLGGSDAAWCICRSDVSQSAQQKALDFACGAGADCTPILQNGACYNPNSVQAHCSYAANSYYQRKGQVQQACDFSGAAVLTNSDPSSSGCTYPATPSAAGTSSSTTPSTVTPSTPGSTTPGSSATPGTVFSPPTGFNPGTPGTVFSPPTGFTPGTPGTVFSPPTGAGGVLPGLGPSGTGFPSTDVSHAGFIPNPSLNFLLLPCFISAMLGLLRLV